LKLELAQWVAAILADDSVFAFEPHDGLGLAFDLGTTTLVGQLLDLRTGYVLGVRTALNVQAQHGADIMSRIECALGGGQALLTRLIREQIGGLARELLEIVPERRAELRDVVIVGNTVMHHFLCGIDVTPLSHTPFEPEQSGLQVFDPEALGWDIGGGGPVRFLPCLGSFVGSDLLAGVLATRLHESDRLSALIDLGTNGEIVVGNRERLLCASTAAGPAFEGARISMGMRAATGAIAAVSLHDRRLQCHVLGHGAPRGLCGSGLVDAVACGLELGVIRPNGRLANGTAFALDPPVQINQSDIRELQLAKGAIAAGLRLLVEQWGATLADLDRIHLAGAFGNYINRASARRIGLLRFPPEQVQPAGNTALLGAKLALFGGDKSEAAYAPVLRGVRHVSLNEDPGFQEVFAEEMAFPDGTKA
jgi:uncharacterized 2Fe-2S/4Fe-4S cluster protein (DUF4445 family)